MYKSRLDRLRKMNGTSVEATEQEQFRTELAKACRELRHVLGMSTDNDAGCSVYELYIELGKVAEAIEDQQG